MLNHITLRVRDLEESKAFFSKALAPLGYRLFKTTENRAGFGIEDIEGQRDFWLIQDNTEINEHSFTCLAFTATNKESVDEFHKNALEAEGKDNGAPGYRPEYHAGYYAAFVFDPDGHNIEAVFDDMEKNI